MVMNGYVEKESHCTVICSGLDVFCNSLRLVDVVSSLHDK